MRTRTAAHALGACTLMALTAGCIHGAAAAPPDPATISADRKGVICAGPDQDGLCATLSAWTRARGVPAGQAISVYSLRTDGAFWSNLPRDARDALRAYQWIMVETAPAPTGTTRLVSALQPAAQGLHPEAGAAASSITGPASCQRCGAAGAGGVN